MPFIYNIVVIYFLFLSQLIAEDSNSTSSYSINIISETNNDVNNQINGINILNDTNSENDNNSSIYEDINDKINATQLDLNETNTTVEQTIIPAIPGIPIFEMPPEIKIHDPDEGPLEPFLHPSNNINSYSDMPSTTSPNQQFIWIQKPEFVAEKGSLEEKYKSLLADDSEDVTLPPEFDNNNRTQTKFIDNTKLITASAKNISFKNVFGSQIPQYYPPHASQYSYPYQPFMYMFPPLIPQYFPSNIVRRMPFIYQNNYNPHLKVGERLKSNSSKPSIPQSVQSMVAKHDFDSLYKVLPKSYVTYGARIQQVAINQNNESEQMTDADIDSLEMLGPIELKQDKQLDKHLTTNRNKLFVNTDHFKVSDSKSYKVSEPIRYSNEIIMTTKTYDLNLPKESLLGLHVLNNNNANLLINNRKMENKNFYVNRKSHFQPKKSHKQNPRHISKAIFSNQYRNNKSSPILSNSNINGQRWKKTIKPKFLFRANFADSKLIIRDKDKSSNKWWNSDQPSYCLEPIYLDTNCHNKKLSKRWSFNEIDHKCYFYEDVCAHVKQNSFLTSRDCFLKCWRIFY